MDLAGLERRPVLGDISILIPTLGRPILQQCLSHIPSSRSGCSAGLNCGLEKVRTCFVAITDDDCFVDREWLENICSHLTQNPGSIVTGRVDAEGDGKGDH